MNSTRFRIGLTAAVAALAGLLGVQTGEAQTMASLPPPAAAAETLGEARPLLAWIDFCRRRPSECTVDTERAGHRRADPAHMADDRLGQPESERGDQADDRSGALGHGRPLGFPR